MQRQTMNREKRGLGTSEAEEGQPEKKRPALASVIVEALKVDSLQKLCSSLEPILRRVVSEEVERALAKLGPSRINGRSSPVRIEGPDGRNLQLQFRSRLSLPLFTGGKVEGEQGAAIHVVLFDASTRRVVTSGPESSAKLDIVVLEGDFNNDDEDGWTQDDFEKHLVKEREGKRPLLTGDVHVTLREGVGTLGELTFTDNSSWIRSRKFRLGLKISSGFCEGVRIQEAKTDAFTVKDHRGELYKKHYPPALNDEVWRLEKIGKDGSFHKRLNKSGIYNVEQFLRYVVRDAQKLRNILGSGMSNKMWEVLVDHAKTCVLGGMLYVYYADDTRNVGVVFNNIYEFTGLISSGHYVSPDSVTESQKVYVDTLVKRAYENWMHVVEYDGKNLLGFNQNKRGPSTRSEVAMNVSDYTTAYDQHQQVSVPRLPGPVPVPVPVPGPTVHSTVEPNLTVGAVGYNDNPANRYPMQPHQVNSNSRTQFDGNTSNENQIIRSSNASGLALGPPQPSTSGFQIGGPSAVQPSNVPYDDWALQRDNRGVDDMFSEEDIRMKSHQILENEDMQHLLRLFNMGGHTSFNATDDGNPFSSYLPSPSPNYSYDEDRGRPSGKAVVGWLKIKAAMRWGIFIRKKAAEKRAQLIELDD
ncbi:hypothetical protein MKW98_014839 [Papaver atlanticum]|uniref:Calmodulin-binding protein n=1 Tax=Papaver atlanticum TaxID=357466 RepID=A0AAD4SF64_9MAGN|nr:hypothetical protein MKW98_014839 [Papaver atlanticum]